MGMLIWPMIAFGWVVNLMQRGTASLDRINQLLSERPSVASPAGVPLLASEHSADIRFRDVVMTFSQRRDALAGINLTIAAGETVAVVGHTGSGKTTLVNLIPRLFDPTSGTVEVGGVDVRRYDPEELRRQIGFIPQETFLFSATLAENIAWGVRDATAEQIRRAAEIAGLGSDIEGFPKGLDTMIGERGLTLSGGQKQRAALARAIAIDPKILILDDALSAVDTYTEEEILARLRGVMRQRTSIIVSHRVSTVRDADLILVLDRGRIVARGTHDELIGGTGIYAELHKKQLLEEELAAS
jgi:ATP-binding cassette subfamily B protein